MSDIFKVDYENNELRAFVSSQESGKFALVTKGHWNRAEEVSVYLTPNQAKELASKLLDFAEQEEPTDRFAMGTPSVDHAGENVSVATEDNGWIKTADRLPDNIERVLVFSPTFADVELAWYEDGNWYYGDRVIKAEVTHWQTPPFYPKEWLNEQKRIDTDENKEGEL